MWSWPPLVLPTWNPGAPELAWLDAIRPALVALRDSGGMIGMHAYSIQPDAPLCAVNPWLSMRHRTVRAHLDALGLVGLPIVITEAARAAGDLPPDVGDFVCWYNAVRGDDGLYGVALWTAGYVAAWSKANLNGHMRAIADGAGG